MRIHTDVLTRADLLAALPARDLHVYSTPHGSRSRAGSHDVALRGFGARHTRAPQQGATFAHADGQAATYSDWGRWLAALFLKDPDAIAGPYKGADDFHAQTCGLYRGDKLAGAVLAFAARLAAGSKRADAFSGVSRTFRVDRWLLERAMFGEL